MDTTEMPRHREKTAAIAQAVLDHLETARPGESFSLKKAAAPHTVPKPDDPKRRDRKIDVTSLTEIVSIDLNARRCTAESGVTFERLVRETLTVGLVPKTVSELKTITIGGAVAGASVESMSYRYGGFHDSCLEYELVTGTGEIVTCSRSERSDLFEMMHGSFGTLGILTLLTFELVPAKRFVRLRYLKYRSFEELMEAVHEHFERQDLEFMDAIVHAPDECVLCAGSFVDEAPYTHSYAFEPFYRSTRTLTEDYLTACDYFFRYDADCHWILRNYGLENRLFRRLLAPWILGSSNILRLAGRLPAALSRPNRPDVVADVFIPFHRIGEFFAWYRALFEYYPLWIVPYRISRMYPWVNPELVKGAGPLYIDCAIYGFRQPGTLNHYRELEKKVAELGGLKTLITHNYYPEQEFWASYNRPAWEAVKAQTDPHNIFRNLYQKTNYRRAAPRRRPAAATSGSWRGEPSRRPRRLPGT